MDFFNRVFGPEDGDMPFDVGKSYSDGMDAAKQMMKIAIDTSKPYAERGDYAGATVVMFVAIWQCVRHAYAGVRKSRETAKAAGLDANDNPVSKVWDMCEATFYADSDEEALAAMDKVMGRKGP